MRIFDKGARRFAGGPLFSFLLAALLCGAAAAQDLKTVTSPDGRIQFSIFVSSQEDTTLYRLAYQVAYRGKTLLDTSFLGFDIWEQEPLLGENVGMVSATTESKKDYNGLTAKYLQNGSLGRAFEVEVRVYDAGVAFRYRLLKSMPMAELFISEETTEFDLGVPVPPAAELPFRKEKPGVGWIEISELAVPGFPALSLGHSSPTAVLSRLSRNPNRLKYIYAGATPFLGPWRIIAVAESPEKLGGATFAKRLTQ